MASKKVRKIILKSAARLAVKGVKRGARKLASDTAQDTAKKVADTIAPMTFGSITLRMMRRSDRKEVREMMREFYSSEATLTNGSDTIFNKDISECLSDSPFLDGYVFSYKDADDSLWGYAMIAHSFSTEFGRHCIWIEDLYLREEARGLGLASHFFDHIEERYPDALLRLEAEYENDQAMEVYRRRGFHEFPYVEMILDRTESDTENSN